MGRYYRFRSGTESMLTLPSALIADGNRIAPRGLRTYELRDVLIEIDNPRDVTMLHIGRNWNKRIAVAEFLQLVGGFSEPEVMSRISPEFDRFKNGGSFHGAYGPRISMQMPKVIDRLMNDPASRQGVSVIWDPLHDLMQEDRLDLPCTIDMVFALRNGKLLMSTHMRSNDVWWGWCYDLFQFAQLQCTVANILHAEVGTYTHFANSFHLYDRDANTALELTPATADQPRLGGLLVHSWQGAQRAALDVWNGEMEDPTVTEDWMMEVAQSWRQAAV